MPLMPLIIREDEITWSQTPDYILIKIPLKGVKALKTNIVTSNDYIRLHYHPYIFELFLSSPVNDAQGKCTILESENLVIFELAKLESGQEWDSLSKKDLDRIQKRVIRDKAVELTQERHAERRKVLQEKRHEQGQMIVRDQIRLDGQERERISEVKQTESAKALSELETWRENVGQGDSKKGDTEENCDENPPPLEEKSNPSKTEEIWTADEVPSFNKNPIPTVQKVPQVDKPSVRGEATIKISFTPREFPTPSRESTAADEEEWLKKQAEARKTCGFNDADLRPEERDPTWLLDKGASLMKAGSYLGAVSAYSHGIKLAPKMPELYVERAGAHLALKNLVKTVEDASEGLELLTPKVAANAALRLKCHKTRAAGFRGLKCYREALMDYKEAVKLDENDEKLKEEFKSCEGIVYEMDINGQDSDSDGE